MNFHYITKSILSTFSIDKLINQLKIGSSILFMLLSLNSSWAKSPSLNSFITTWQTPTINTTVTFPLTAVSGTNMTIDWGDDTVQTGLGNNPTHTYATAGTYTVTVDGVYDRVYFNDTGSKSLIFNIVQWGAAQWSVMDSAFYGCNNLQSTATDVPNLSQVTSMNSMFRKATSFNGNISNWNVSSVTNMIAIFMQASSFNQNIGNWNVSNVTQMSNMFQSASSFNQNIGSWNVSNVTNMNSMFDAATNFNQNISGWNVGHVIYMNSMFLNAISFNQPIGSWNVSNVTQMSNMFQKASSFNQNISGWNVGNVINMNSMFHEAFQFNQPIGTWDVSHVITMGSMFRKAISFNGDISNWNVSSVTNMGVMFFEASAFNKNLGSWNVSNVNDMWYMFNSATNFNQNISGWNVSNVTNMLGMFANATNFNQNLGSWNVGNVTNMASFLIGVTLSIANYDALLTGWSTQTLKPSVTFSGGNSKYCAGATARQTIISTNNWVISDGGVFNAEINLQGNSVSIVSADLTPSLSDTTYFGVIGLNTPTTKTYTIQNTGASALSVSGISLSGSNASLFTVGGITFPKSIAANASTTFTITFNSLTIGNNTALVTVTNNDCDESMYTFGIQAVSNNCLSAVWTGTASTSWNSPTNWSCGEVPNVFSDVTIDVTSSQPLLVSDVAINSLTLNSGTTLIVPSGFDLTVTNYIHNSGTLTIENNANLIQVDNVANTGNIIVNRNSAPIVRLDHTLWSSPVTGTQTLQQFSPNTLSNRFYNYTTSSNSYTAIPASSTFVAGKGFAVRAPNNQTVTTPTVWPGTFTGVPNNGTIPFTLDTTGARYNLVGNPYPSTIDAASFVAGNSNITGTLYFYAHSLSMNASGFFPAGSTNYTYWNSTGSAAATNASDGIHLTPQVPNGIIQVGQGFLVKANNTGSTLNFTNAMRTGSNGNQFFRMDTVEKHRLWLNLKTGAGIEINQILVGYITDATQAEDRDFDGLSFGNTGSFLSSKIGTNNYVIQGRSLPFDSNDIVPLGFTADTAGAYSISLTNSDGIFADTQDVFLKDDLTGTTHDIKASAYDFASNAGTFDGRFSLIYTNALANNSTSFTSNSVVVFKPNQWFTINTNGTIMKDVLVYDMAGRLIFQQSDINANTTVLKGLSPTNGVLLVKIVSQENEVVTVKVSN